MCCVCVCVRVCVCMAAGTPASTSHQSIIHPSISPIPQHPAPTDPAPKLAGQPSGNQWVTQSLSQPGSHSVSQSQSIRVSQVGGVSTNERRNQSINQSMNQRKEGRKLRMSPHTHTRAHTYTRRMPQLSVCLSTFSFCLSSLSLLQQVKLGRSICCVMSVNMQVGMQAGGHRTITQHTHTHVHHDAVGIHVGKTWLSGCLSVCLEIHMYPSLCLLLFLPSNQRGPNFSAVCGIVGLSVHTKWTDRQTRRRQPLCRQAGSRYRLRRPTARLHTLARTCVCV